MRIPDSEPRNGSSGPRIRLHVNGQSLGLSRGELSYAPPAEHVERVTGVVYSFIPPEPVVHPEEVSLDVISESLPHEGRTYPTFGAETHWDQEQ